MKILADTHTHTIASTHAYSTVAENAQAAAARGLKVLAITDHAPGIVDAPHELHFMNYHVLQKEMYGVRMLYGAELNILDYNGSLDLNEDIYKRMDICIASFHDNVIKPSTIQDNTRAMLGAMQNPYVCILGHPDDGRIPVDYEALVLEAKRCKVLLEINNSSLRTAYYRLNTRENMKIMLGLCEKHAVPVVLGTDAHAAHLVGDMLEANALLEEIRFPEELVMNTQPENLVEFLASKR